jgi:hypothetical protein
VHVQVFWCNDCGHITVLRSGEVVSSSAPRRVIAQQEGNEIQNLRKQVERLENALDNLKVQATRDIAEGWVCVPAVEWNANITVNALGTCEWTFDGRAGCFDTACGYGIYKPKGAIYCCYCGGRIKEKVNED